MPHIQAGSGIFLERPTRYSISHLWLVVTEPAGDPQEVLIVNLTTLREGVDTTVVLTNDDHPYIMHPTVVYYADARTVEVELLYRLIALDPERIYRETCSEELIEKVRAGLLESHFTPRKIKNYFRQQSDL